MKYNPPKIKIPEGKVAIYYLYDPKYPTILKYIGKTKHGFSDRMVSHIIEAKKTKSGKRYKCDWINHVLKEGRYPHIALLTIVPESIWEETERKYIKIMRLLGYPLTNISEGGDSGNPIGYVHTKEMKEKRSEWMRGNRNACGRKTKEHIMKMVESRNGKGREIIMLDPITLEKLKIFKSIKAASKSLGHENHTVIWAVCNNRQTNKTAYGFKWSYA